MFTAEIKTDKLVLGIDSLRDALLGAGEDASMVVEDETRRLSRIIAAFVPPLAKGGSARRIGEMAVERDLKNLISEAKPNLIDEVGSKYGVRDIRAAYVTEATGAKLNLQWDRLDPSGARLEEYHRLYRNRDGRVPKVTRPQGVWAARVVVPVGTRADYIKKAQAHVGHWKATFAKIGALLGDKYPNWINRHFNSPLAIADKSKLSNREAPSVLFGSKAGGNKRLRQQVQAAVNARAKVIVRRIKLILSGYNKDLASGMKAQKHAKDYSEPMTPVDP